MPRASFYAYDLVTRAVVDELPITAATFSDVVSGIGGFAATIPVERLGGLDRASIEPAARGLAIDLDDRLLFAGPIFGLRGNADAPVAELTGEGTLGLYAGGRRTIRNLNGWTERSPEFPGRNTEVRFDTSVDLGLIVLDIFQHCATVAGDVGLAVDLLGPGAGGELERTLPATLTIRLAERREVYALLEELAGLEEGLDFGYRYEWEAGVDGNGRPLITLEVARVRGTRTGLVFEEGKNLTVLDWNVDGTRTRTALDAIGAGEGDNVVTASVAKPSLIAPAGIYPRLEGTVTHKRARRRERLASLARDDLNRVAGPVESIRVEVTDHRDAPLGSFKAGDLARFYLDNGLVTVAGWWRIIALDTTLDEDGNYRLALDAVPEALYGDAFTA